MFQISQMFLSMTKFAEDLLRRFGFRIDNDIKWKFRGWDFRPVAKIFENLAAACSKRYQERKRKQLLSFPAHSGIYTPLRVALFGFFERPEALERNL